MKDSLILILFLFIFLSCDNEPYTGNIELLDPEQSFNVILIAGQSNTHAGIGFNSNLDSPISEIKQLGRFGEDNMRLIEAKEPLQHHTAENNKIGFGLTYAKLLFEYLNEDKKIIIIPCGYGATGFQNNRWNKGDDLYEDAVKRVKNILSYNSENKLISILWHQGESDVSNSNYQNNLDNFITNIRNDLEAENIPFILGGMVPFWVNQNSSRINQQMIISSSINRHDYVGYANPELPFIIQREDNTFEQIHFDANGQRELGKRYFQEFIRIIEQ